MKALIGMSRVIFFIMVALGVVVWLNWPEKPHFTKANIEQTEKNIRTQFEKRGGLKVHEVKMVKESDRKLIGYARLEVDGVKELGKLFNSDGDGIITKPCSATMGDDWQWIWRCE